MGEFPARFWREPPEKLATDERTEIRGERTMDLITKTAKLNWIVTLLALTLAAVAAQSPLF